MARTSGDTMAEGLRKILAQLPVLGTMPDADMEFLMKLQMVIMQRLRATGVPGSETTLAASPSGGPPPGMGPGGPGMVRPPGPPGMIGGPGPVPIPPGTPGGIGLGGPGGPLPGLVPQAPNMDELRRALGGGPRGAEAA